MPTRRTARKPLPKIGDTAANNKDWYVCGYSKGRPMYSRKESSLSGGELTALVCCIAFMLVGALLITPAI